MHIIVNGQARELDAAATLDHLIQVPELKGSRIAVEINGEIVPRGRHEGHCLHEGDRVEIVQAIGGG